MSTTTTTKPTRVFLAGGLGRFQAADPTAAARFGGVAGGKALVAREIEKAAEFGFEVVTIDVNPHEPAASLAELRAVLESRQFDGVSFGFGLRGIIEFTALFEDMVNAAREMQPQARLGFSRGPDDIAATIERIFPEVRKA